MDTPFAPSASSVSSNEPVQQHAAQWIVRSNRLLGNTVAHLPGCSLQGSLDYLEVDDSELDLLGADAPARRAVAALCAHLSSLSPEATWRHHLRQEPDAVIPLVRIRGGGYEQSSSLLRLSGCSPHRDALVGAPGA